MWTGGLLFSLPPALWFSIANGCFSKHDNTMCAGLRKKKEVSRRPKVIFLSYE
jgi:hypothetical protein